jgi:spermidine synthase
LISPYFPVIDSLAEQRIPRAYYGPNGSLGFPLTTLPVEQRSRRLAVIGLGTGALNLYSREGEHIDFYEIDPTIKDIASNPDYFTYLSLGKGTHSFFIGDGRLKMQDASPGEYDLIVVDAFGSDSIPVHLLTAEALDIFISRLKADGALIVHISNRYLDLEPPLGRYASERGYTALARSHRPDQAEQSRGQFRCDGVVIAREVAHLRPLSDTGDWRKPEVGRHLWTDRHSSILPYIHW